MKGQRKNSDEARPLPYSAYPRARDVSQHGIQPLPASLPLDGYVSYRVQTALSYVSALSSPKGAPHDWK